MQLKDYVTQNQQTSFRQFLSKTFFTMFMGLMITTVFAILGYMAINTNPALFIGPQTFVILIVQLGVAWFFSLRLMTMSKGAAWTCFIVYSALTGITFATLPIIYGGSSILFAVIMTTILFACMAIIGHTTNVDLTKFGTYFMIGLWMIIIVSIVNIFVGSSGLDLMLTYAGIILFLGITAYDVQVLRKMYVQSLSDGELAEKLVIFGAFQLYLDFINLFLRILELYGRSRD